MRPEKINRRDQFRTITVGAYPKPGVLSSEVLAGSKPDLDRLRANLPPGVQLQIAGEQEKQDDGFPELARGPRHLGGRRSFWLWRSSSGTPSSR